MEKRNGGQGRWWLWKEKRKEGNNQSSSSHSSLCLLFLPRQIFSFISFLVHHHHEWMKSLSIFLSLPCRSKRFVSFRSKYLLSFRLREGLTIQPNAASLSLCSIIPLFIFLRLHLTSLFFPLAILILPLSFSVILSPIFRVPCRAFFTFDSFFYTFIILLFGRCLIPPKKRKDERFIVSWTSNMWHFIRSKWSYIWAALHFFLKLLWSNFTLMRYRCLPLLYLIFLVINQKILERERFTTSWKDFPIPNTPSIALIFWPFCAALLNCAPHS